MGKLLSIVVPSYNAEKFLEHNLNTLCIEGVSEDLEVIVVDDGSKDRTAHIIDDYAERYPDIIVAVHKENGGHGSGINTGIKYATGKYFRVIDADDWADEGDLKNLLKFIRENCLTDTDKVSESFTETKEVAETESVMEPKMSEGSGECSDSGCRTAVPDSTDVDIIAGGYYWVYGHDDSAPAKEEFTEPFKGVSYGQVYRFDDIADKAYIKMHSMTIRTEILKANNIRIDEHCFYVDTEYILYPIPYVNTIVFLDDHLYRYSIDREGQSMNPAQMQRNKTQFDHVLDELCKFYENVSGKDVISPAKKLYIEHLIARVYAGRIKILLWDKISSETKKELMDKESKLKDRYPGIYNNNLNRAIKLLRLSGYLLYRPAALLCQMKK